MKVVRVYERLKIKAMGRFYTVRGHAVRCVVHGPVVAPLGRGRFQVRESANLINDSRRMAEGDGTVRCLYTPKRKHEQFHLQGDRP